jgi:hypothetical protein
VRDMSCARAPCDAVSRHKPSGENQIDDTEQKVGALMRLCVKRATTATP